MTMTRASSLYNGSFSGRQALLSLVVLLSLVASEPVLSFGYLYHPKRGSGSRLSAPLFVASKDTGSNSSSSSGISHLANDANLSTLTKDNPTWDQNIAALLEHNATYGTVNVPHNSKKYPNLAGWLRNLRVQQGRLAKDQIQQLNDIGFLWKESKRDKEERRWHENFVKLQAYKGKYGDCLVPAKYEADPPLGGWVSRHRQYYKQENLSADRIQKLESIGFVWALKPGWTVQSELYEKNWNIMYEELVAFKEVQGHTHVPLDYPPNRELGIWVHNQKLLFSRGTLRKDRQEQLDKIGFTWEFDQIRGDSWLEQYEELKKYYQDLAKYKEIQEKDSEGSTDLKVPILGKRLIDWRKLQRLLQSKGDLDPKRKAMLDDVGFDWWD